MSDLSTLVRAWFPDLPDYRAPEPVVCGRGHEHPRGEDCPTCKADRKRAARRKAAAVGEGGADAALS